MKRDIVRPQPLRLIPLHVQGPQHHGRNVVGPIRGPDRVGLAGRDNRRLFGSGQIRGEPLDQLQLVIPRQGTDGWQQFGK
jgi:hypothetical protein